MLMDQISNTFTFDSLLDKKGERQKKITNPKRNREKYQYSFMLGNLISRFYEFNF